MCGFLWKHTSSASLPYFLGRFGRFWLWGSAPCQVLTFICINRLFFFKETLFCHWRTRIELFSFLLVTTVSISRKNTAKLNWAACPSMQRGPKFCRRHPIPRETSGTDARRFFPQSRPVCHSWPVDCTSADCLYPQWVRRPRLQSLIHSSEGELAACSYGMKHTFNFTV